MRNGSIAVVLAVALVAGVAFAAGSEAPAKAASRTHDMTVQVVSVDKRAKTITIKDDKGETKAIPVLGHATQRLSMVRTGGMFTLTCEDNEKGEHQGIVAIKAAKSSPK
jgi:hypothetical protein